MRVLVYAALLAVLCGCVRTGPLDDGGDSLLSGGDSLVQPGDRAGGSPRCPSFQIFYEGQCRPTCDSSTTCPAGLSCAVAVCLPASTCQSDADCATGTCQCTDATCSAGGCSPIECGCQFNTDGDGSCDGVIGLGVANFASTCGPELTCNGRGGCQLDLGGPCSVDDECGSGNCADGRCCDSPCEGDCDVCNESGQCTESADDCAGECAFCASRDGGFSCVANNEACDVYCANSICTLDGNEFGCDLSTCNDCATTDMPDFTGECSTGVDMLLPTGCVYTYSWLNPLGGNLMEWAWGVYQCTDSVWVWLDGGADAGTCGGSCPAVTNERWFDKCGGAADSESDCP